MSAVAALALVGEVFAQIPDLTFTPIPIPQPRSLNPQAIGAGSGGRIWFTDDIFVQVGYFGPDNSITKFPLTTLAEVEATNQVPRPLNIVEGPDGNGWFTGYTANRSGMSLDRSFVGRVTPAGQISKFPLPTGNACVNRQVFGVLGCGITVGPDGNLWFVETEVKKIGTITTAGAITEFAVNIPGTLVFPVHITSGADGNLWFTENIRGSIWRVTTAGAATEFRITSPAAPVSIAKGPDGNVWFTSTNSIGRITPAGVITKFSVPAIGSNAGVAGIVTGPDNNIWFTEANDKQVGRFTPSTEGIAEASVPNGDSPVQIVATRGAGKSALQNGGGTLYILGLNAQLDATPQILTFAALPQCRVTCTGAVIAIAPAGARGVAVSFPPGGFTVVDCPPNEVRTIPPSGSFFPIGTTRVTVERFSGATCTFDVIVLPEIQVDTSGNLLFAGIKGHPVNTTTGELYEEVPPDLYLGGPIPLFESRYHASGLARDNNLTSALGTNWAHNFDWSVKSLVPDGSRVGVVSPRGRFHQFVASGNNFVLQSPTEVPVQLIAAAGGMVFADPIAERTYTFNSSGRLTRIDDSHGNALTLTYSGNNLAQVSDGLGRTLTYAYDASNHLTSVTDGTRTIRFTHAGNNLATFVDALGKTTTYAYDDAGRLRSSTMPRGNVPYSQTYDSSGRVATQTAGGANTTTFSYTASATTITDAAGMASAQAHNALPGGQETSYTDEANASISMSYDSAGRRTSVTDRMGNTTRVIYHAPSGKVAEIASAEGARTTFTYGTRTFNGVTFYPLTGVTYADGTTELFTYDGNGNLLSRTDRAGKQSTFTVNNRGQVLTATNATGGVVSITYNGDGTASTSRDSDTGVTTLAYDSLRRLNRITRPDGAAVQIEYDANDRVTAITDELGRRFTYAYDTNDNLTQVTDPASKTLQFAYDALDRVTQTTNRVGGVTRMTYNNRELPATVVDANNNQIALAYDARRRLTSVTDPAAHAWTTAYDDEGLPTSTSNPLNQTFSWTRNRLGLIASMRNPLGQQWSLGRDAMQRLTSITDPLSRTTALGYDSRGLLSRVTRPGIGEAQYQRNDLGLISSIRDLNGQSWQRGYTAVGRLQSARDPLGRSTTFAYDGRGRVSGVTFPDSTALTNTFDAVGNVTRASYSGGPDLQFGYDALNRLTAASGTTIAYDDESRPVSTTSRGTTSGAAYDGAGRLTSITYNGGAFAVNYTYDARDLVTRVTDTLTNTQINLAYDDARRLTGITRPNGVNTTYTYDAAGRLTRIQEGMIIDLRYSIDAAGQITAQEGVTPLDPQGLTLPNLDATFTHDSASQISGGGFGSDPRGRLTSGAGHTFGWDGASRLIRIDATTFEYDGLGQLLRRGGPATTDYSYNLALGVGTIVSDGARFYVRLPNGSLLYAIEGTNVIHYHLDHVGSTLALTNAAGAVTDSYAYEPYGVLLAHQGSSPQPFTYIGRHGVRFEPAANLYQMRARYYDPSSARFLSKDPISSIDPQEINPYQYALQSPVQFVDVSGLDPRTWNQDQFSDNDFYVPDHVFSASAQGYQLLALGSDFELATTTPDLSLTVPNGAEGESLVGLVLKLLPENASNRYWAFSAGPDQRTITIGGGTAPARGETTTLDLSGPLAIRTLPFLRPGFGDTEQSALQLPRQPKPGELLGLEFSLNSPNTFEPVRLTNDQNEGLEFSFTINKRLANQWLLNQFNVTNEVPAGVRRFTSIEVPAGVRRFTNINEPTSLRVFRLGARFSFP